MANESISQLPSITNVTGNCLLLFTDVNDPNQANRSKQGTVSQVLAGLGNATDSVPGLMSAADKTILDAATSSATNSTLMNRDSSGNTSLNVLTAASVTLGGNPTSSLQAATKAYVDASTQGLHLLAPVNVATVGVNIALSGSAPAILDGVNLTTSSRILVKDQSNPIQNGVYSPSSVGSGSNGTWARTTDANTTGQLVTGTYVFVTGGTINANSAYAISTTGTITIGTSSITWLLYSNISTIAAASIVGLLTSGQIGSVSASAIIGSISATQIGSINANAIIGSITASQIGSVNAGSISGSITASQIGSVNATSIAGSITSSQISSVAATTITGTITSGQISTVNAGAVVGTITASQIGSVNATSITGVVVTSQLQTGIIDSLNLIANNLMVVQQVSSLPTLPNAAYPVNSTVLNTTSKILYKNVAGTWTAQTASSTLVGTLTSTDIGSVSASTITGLIISSQIQSVAATTITGSITSTQIGSVSASAITGSITSSQISSVAAASITGSISSGQIGSVSASVITGSISSGQIGSVDATAIIGSITSSQISSVDATTITGSIDHSQIGSINAATITVGQIGSSQIASVDAGSITAGTITASVTIGSGGSLTAGSGTTEFFTDGTQIILGAFSIQDSIGRTVLNMSNGSQVREDFGVFLEVPNDGVHHIQTNGGCLLVGISGAGNNLGSNRVYVAREDGVYTGAYLYVSTSDNRFHVNDGSGDHAI